MTYLTDSQLKTQLDAYITQNVSRLNTGAHLNEFLTNLNDSKPNFNSPFLGLSNFDASRDYVAINGICVVYDGAVWQCTTDHSGLWNPAHFTQISETVENVQDVIGAMMIDSASVTWVYNDTLGTLTATAISENLGSDDLTSSDAIRRFHLNGNLSTDKLIVDDGTNDVFVVSGNGNVGIGKSTPLARLHLVGAGNGNGISFIHESLDGTDRNILLDNGRFVQSAATSVISDSDLIANTFSLYVDGGLLRARYKNNSGVASDLIFSTNIYNASDTITDNSRTLTLKTGTTDIYNFSILNSAGKKGYYFDGAGSIGLGTSNFDLTAGGEYTNLNFGDATNPASLGLHFFTSTNRQYYAYRHFAGSSILHNVDSRGYYQWMNQANNAQTDIQFTLFGNGPRITTSSFTGVPWQTGYLHAHNGTYLINCYTTNSFHGQIDLSNSAGVVKHVISTSRSGSEASWIADGMVLGGARGRTANGFFDTMGSGNTASTITALFANSDATVSFKVLDDLRVIQNLASSVITDSYLMNNSVCFYTDGTSLKARYKNNAGTASDLTIGGGSGTVTTVSIVTANGVSGSVATATTTPAITLTLGAITPTSVTTTADIKALGSAATTRVVVSADNNVAKIFSWRTADTPRWAARVDGNETGSNVGGDWALRRYNDAGTYIDSPISIVRSTGAITMGVVSASTVNGLTLTTSTGVLTIANGKTATVSNTLTFTGTDSSSVNFGAGGVVSYKVGTGAYTPNTSISGITRVTVTVTVTGAATTDKVVACMNDDMRADFVSAGSYFLDMQAYVSAADTVTITYLISTYTTFGASSSVNVAVLR